MDFGEREVSLVSFFFFFFFFSPLGTEGVMVFFFFFFFFFWPTLLVRERVLYDGRVDTYTMILCK